MEPQVLQIVGKIAGIGGIALGVFLLLFRGVIRKNIFPKLAQEQAFRLIRQFMYLTFIASGLGIVAWVYTSKTEPSAMLDKQKTEVKEQKDLLLSGTVINAKDNTAIAQAEVNISGSSAHTITDDSGNFYLSINEQALKQTAPVRLRVAKPGFRSADLNVSPPVQNLVIPLSAIQK